MPDSDRATQEMFGLLSRWEAQNDRRAIFLGCYARMTGNMISAIEAGEFRDPIWVSALLYHFAAYYFVALDAYERGDVNTPVIWRETFDAARREETPVLFNLILGVNAHINYDLIFALVDALEHEWPELSPADRDARYRDHIYVNQIIARTVDAVQDEVLEQHAPALDLLDKLLGPIDEWAASRLISGWRDKVWEWAVRLLDAADPAERDRLKREIEPAVLDRVRFLMR